MKKIVFAAMAWAMFLPAVAQDTYESARLLGEDLNGTARYVGMGGAMEALGADISTIGTNPAGVGERQLWSRLSAGGAEIRRTRQDQYELRPSWFCLSNLYRRFRR